MNRLATPVVLGLLTVLALAVPALAIVGGQSDPGNEYEASGAIVITKQPAKAQTFTLPQTHSSCTLIHPRVAVTAAHSVESIQSFIDNHDDVELSDFGVILRPSVYESGAHVYRIQEMRMHPDFPSSGRDEASVDVGVLILSEAVTGVTPAALPPLGYLASLGLDPGTTESSPKFEVVGYGMTDVPKLTPKLPPGERRYAFASYKALRPHYLILSQSFELGEGGISRGDSGGSCYWTRADGTRVLAGVAILSDAASVAHGGCVRTDVATVRSFLDAAIQDAGN